MMICENCMAFFEGEPELCCNGDECGCMGLPAGPMVCSQKCADALSEKMRQHGPMVLRSCAHCENEFFSDTPECPECGFGSYKVLNIYREYSIGIGNFRIGNRRKEVYRLRHYGKKHD